MSLCFQYKEFQTYTAHKTDRKSTEKDIQDSMGSMKLQIIFIIISVAVASTAYGSVIPDAEYRAKRQTGDLLVAEYNAWLGLGGQFRRGGCIEVACGLVDIHEIGKRKRNEFQPLIQPPEDERRWELAKAIVAKVAQDLSLEK